MGFMRKSGIETIDYTLLQKKGFIKKPEENKSGLKVDSQGMLDLTSNANSQSGTPAQMNNESINPFGFLDSLAQSSSSSGLGNISSNDNAEISTLKIKIDDLEFKLAQLIDKLSIIESKLGNFESRVLG